MFSGDLLAKRNVLYADVKLTVIESEKSEFGWERKDKTTPKYPLKLAKKGITGCSIFKITINENGKANVDETVSFLPNKALLKESQKLLKSWKWENLGDLKGDSATVRLDYCMGGSSIEEAKQLCLKQSQMQCE
jgi:hypothetical protein